MDARTGDFFVPDPIAIVMPGLTSEGVEDPGLAGRLLRGLGFLEHDALHADLAQINGFDARNG